MPETDTTLRPRGTIIIISHVKFRSKDAEPREGDENEELNQHAGRE